MDSNNKLNIAVLNLSSKSAKNVVRDFVYGCWCKGKRIGGMKMPPTNLLIVAAVLKNEGHRVKFIDTGFAPHLFDELKADIKNYHMAAALTSTNSFNEDISVLEELKKKNPSLFCVIFGSHPTFMPQHCLSKSVVDAGVRAEPEFVIRDLAGNLSSGEGDWQKVKGIAYRDDSKVIINDPYPFIEDLDQLPIPDRSFLPPDVHYFNPAVKRMPYTTAQTSRGCPGRCIFCTVPYFYGRKVRCRSAQSVIDEIKYLASLGYREIFFRDETFTYFKKRNIEICQEILKDNIDVTWICNARVGTVDKGMLALFKSAGCHLIKFGVESGNQAVLDSMNKGIKLEQTEQDFRLCRKAGIDTHAHVMIGNIGETEATLRQTIDFVINIKPTTATFGICTPYPGTELFRTVAEQYPEIADGSSCDLRRIHTSSFFSGAYTSLSKEAIEQWVRRAYRKFYMRPSYITGQLRRLSSVDELKRVTIAGLNVFDFVLRGDK